MTAAVIDHRCVDAPKPREQQSPAATHGRRRPRLLTQFHEAIVGRATDFLKAEGGSWVQPAHVVALLGEVLEDGTFQARQAADRTLEVRVLERAPRPRGWRQAVVDRLRELAGRRTTCTVRFVAGRPRSWFGKRRYIVSERTRRGLARPAEPTSQTPWPIRPHPDAMNRSPSC